MLLCFLALSLAVAQRAEAFVYWTNETGFSIGRANVDGSGVNQDFITGLGHVKDVIVDDACIYWTVASRDAIGRAGLDGTDVDPDFITGCSGPDGLAIYDGHIYWADSTGTIGQAALDGSGVDKTWIDCSATPHDLTQNGGYFYWSWYPSPYYYELPQIGRYNALADGGTVYTSILDGWIDPVSALCATPTHLYWRSSGAIGRATAPDGLDSDREYLTGLEGCGGGLAVLNDFIYYTTAGLSGDQATIGRVGTDGSGLDNAFITGCQTPAGVAADGLTAATSVAVVADQIAAAGLPKSLATPLVQKLRNACRAIDRGSAVAARNLVSAAIRQIEAQADKRISQAEAERWITALGLLKEHIV
jgi:hypothetical protein